VVNIAEGRRADVLGRLARAGGESLLDVHHDPDHDRSVFTIAAHDPATTVGAARRLATDAAEHVTLADYRGVHPLLGVVDVVPFVALPPTTHAVATTEAVEFARWWSTEAQVPTFLYDDADVPARRSLPVTRRDAFRLRAPDCGPAVAHPLLGASAVGAREVLVAVNVELGNDDVTLARTVARRVRERDGGLRGVRALGLELSTRGHAQVSMNLTALRETGVERAVGTVRDAIEAGGGTVACVELVGLLPAAELERCSDAFVAWSGLSERQTIEGRAADAGGARRVSDKPA
jgi:glutamate formiminotransferase